MWRLSEFEPGQPAEEYKTPGTIIANIVKKPQKAKFIPFVKVDELKKLIEEKP